MQTADTGSARRIVELQEQLHREKLARLKAEQVAAGCKSAMLKLHAKVAAFEAKEAAAKAEQPVA